MKKDKQDLCKFASFWGFVAMVAVAIIIYTIEVIVVGRINYGIVSIVCIYQGISCLYKTIKTNDKIYGIGAIIWTIVAIISLGVYINDISVMYK